MASGLPDTVDDLGLSGALDVGALALAQSGRLRVAPTRRMTLALMERLREARMIDVPWPEPRWEIAPESKETPIEGLQWRLAWKAYPVERLPEAVADYLRSVERDEYGSALRLRRLRDPGSVRGRGRGGGWGGGWGGIWYWPRANGSSNNSLQSTSSTPHGRRT